MTSKPLVTIHSNIITTDENDEGISSGERYLLPLHITHKSKVDNIIIMPDDERPPRRRGENTTDSTLFSSAASAIWPTYRSAKNRRNTSSQQKKKKDKRRLHVNLNKVALPNIQLSSSRRDAQSEIQLRKKVKRSAERGDWDAVQKLITGYHFSDTPVSYKKGNNNTPPPIQEETTPQAAAVDGSATSRRPSYGGSREQRRSFTGSFTGGESAAAAAVIQASILEESSDDKPPQHEALDTPCPPVMDRPDIGENILHDVCQYHPPLVVIESLLASLKHRKGLCIGTDGDGCTPLHLAVCSGSKPEVIDALIRADPAPASMGDFANRSPLHLAMRYLVNIGKDEPQHYCQHSRNHHVHIQEETRPPQDAEKETYQIVLILKDAMMTYPGKIDFKDEDKSGYSPLDYAIEGNMTNKALIQKLARRRAIINTRRSVSKQNSSRVKRSSGSCGRSVLTYSSNTEAQDINVLHQLEQDEIEARRLRLRKMKSKSEKVSEDEGELFDIFGIDPAQRSKGEVADLSPCIPQESSAVPQEQGGDTTSILSPDQELPPQELNDSAIYNKHLQAYMEDYMDGYGFEEDLLDQNPSDSSFDIFQDPELVADAQRTIDEYHGRRNVNDFNEAQVLLNGEILPNEIGFLPTQDDECVSVFSEVTVPDPIRRRRSRADSFSSFASSKYSSSKY